ncbi:MAG: chitobiase/beta-hexosaminidase C-terminal domain-containing protein, partial [Bacteroidaceae bacterium]|nr:chitobiase/beta-hexosaminidase C-terminal domain-containing protein [Bacteroidaceae bacterium]
MNQRFIYLLLILYCQILTIQAQPTFSKKHGLYEVKNLIVGIKSSDPEAEIHYTTDGSTPTAESPTYKSYLHFSKTTCLRAVEVKDGAACSPVTTASYLFISSILGQQGTPEGYPSQWGPYCEISGTAQADYDMDAAMTTNEKLIPHIKQGL